MVLDRLLIGCGVYYKTGLRQPENLVRRVCLEYFMQHSFTLLHTFIH